LGSSLVAESHLTQAKNEAALAHIHSTHTECGGPSKGGANTYRRSCAEGTVSLTSRVRMSPWTSGDGPVLPLALGSSQCVWDVRAPASEHDININVGKLVDGMGHGSPKGRLVLQMAMGGHGMVLPTPVCGGMQNRTTWGTALPFL